MKQKLFIVYGTGNDSVGLVGKLTTKISEIKGNIVDLRQDVIHGLFTVFLVVDLAKSKTSLKELQKVLEDISSETGLELYVEKYTPVARPPEKTNLLLILLGKDKEGIIAAVSEILGHYNVNIEFSQMIARENIFLMELHTDISHSTLPVDNLKSVLSEKMDSIKINTIFQEEDVFNKKKRMILFDVSTSFIDDKTFDHILANAGLKAKDISEAFSEGDTIKSLRKVARSLEGLPYQVLKSIVESISVSSETLELIQTLKIMGYKIGLISHGLSFFTNLIKEKLDIDYAFGFETHLDHDAQTLSGKLSPEVSNPLNTKKILSCLEEMESIGDEDVTILPIQEHVNGCTSGIRLNFDMKIFLDYYNHHILNKEALIGLLGSFGIPRIQK